MELLSLAYFSAV
uniref:Uncharacterized protein n=1 Tax=Rhizophora mucronata TaxID=61149 RepID=A0A2P2PD59_RHIMU